MKNFIYTLFIPFVFLGLTNLQAQEVEEVIVTAEKRSESLQDISQAVTVLTAEDIDQKNITTFTDLSAIAPGVTVAKNEGYKTVISIRGVGNETNQNAIAAPSVAYHLDGIFIASPFALQTDFIDIDRIEVLRGPQGTLFGQNSTGGAINVISQKPSTDGDAGAFDVTLGDYGLQKFRGTSNFVVNDSIATRLSISSTERDGFSKNVVTGQDLDDANNLSVRSDWMIDMSETSTLRLFGQYFSVDRNGAAIRGIDDQTSGVRNLSQDTISKHELTSSVFAAIYESDLGYANLRVLGSVQEDDILVVRDNDRHNFGDPVLAIPGLGAGATYQRAEFNPETSLVDTKTFEVNLISNEPALNGNLDWTVGAFYMEHDIENHIRGYRDNDLDGEIMYVCGESFADPNNCYTVGGDLLWFLAEFDFVTDAFPSRESYSVYGQTTYSFSDKMRLISGLRYSEDEVSACVKNFFATVCDDLNSSSDKTTGRIAAEYDLDDDTMVYVAFTAGFKPGGTNLTYGYADDNAPPMVFETFEPESVEAFEFGLKTDLLDGRAIANIAAFSYTYEDLQFQATDPDPYRGGVANIPESEMSGVEVEFNGFLTDSLSLDVKMSFLDSEVTSDYEVLDNVDAYQYFFGEEDLRYALRENVKGNELAKTPGLTADVSMVYETSLPSGKAFTGIFQYTRRGDFQQRVNNNPIVDDIDKYTVFNLTASFEINSELDLDVMVLNASDEDGVNSSMTDVFGVAATGLELIPPRQIMTRLRYTF